MQHILIIALLLLFILPAVGAETFHLDEYNSKQTVSDGDVGNYDDVTFAPYMQELQSSIKMNWNIPKNAKIEQKTVVLFKIDKTGKLLACGVYKSSGDKDFDKSVVDAVYATAPFKPLPVEYKKNIMDIMFTFENWRYSYFK